MNIRAEKNFARNITLSERGKPDMESRCDFEKKRLPNSVIARNEMRKRFVVKEIKEYENPS